MKFFKYTAKLEEENRELKAKIAELEARNHELTLSLLSSSKEIAPKPEPRHNMERGDNHASCSCGWNTIQTDPVKLQNEISNHYRGMVAQKGRKSWPQTLAKLERLSNEVN